MWCMETLPCMAFFPCNYLYDSMRKTRLIEDEVESVTRDERHIFTYVTSSQWYNYVIKMTNGQNRQNGHACQNTVCGVSTLKQRVRYFEIRSRVFNWANVNVNARHTYWAPLNPVTDAVELTLFLWRMPEGVAEHSSSFLNCRIYSVRCRW